jgi:hypothetical protein
MYSDLRPLRPSRAKDPERYDRVLSSWRCTPHTQVNTSCLFHNLYLRNRTLHVVLLKDDENPLPTYELRYTIYRDRAADVPKELRFNSVEEAEAALAKDGAVDVSMTLTLYYALMQEWAGNFAHTMFDGLYPSYLGLIEFGLQHETFDSIVGVTLNQGLFPPPFLQVFGGGSIYTFNDMQAMYRMRYLRLANVVLGGYNKGQHFVQMDAAMPGRNILGCEYFSQRFRDRYNITSRSASAKDRININIFLNKRWTDAEVAQLRAMVDRINSRPAPTPQSKKAFARLLSFADFGGDFGRQLQFLLDTDVFVTGVGTNMFSAPFMGEGSVVVHTGWCNQGLYKKGSDVAFPFWMNTALCGAMSYERCLYVDTKNVCTQNNGLINATEIEAKINEGIALVKNGFSMPVASIENLPLEDKIFVEFCSLNRASCQKLLYKMNEDYIWIEYVVYEAVSMHPSAQSVTPYFDRQLLRSVRDKYRHLMQPLLHLTTTTMSTSSMFTTVKTRTIPDPRTSAQALKLLSDPHSQVGKNTH